MELYTFPEMVDMHLTSGKVGGKACADVMQKSFQISSN
jgi:hypothetical protein